MDSDEYQIAAMRTLSSGTYLPEASRDDLLVNAALGLAGEAGEFADIIKKVRFQGHELTDAVKASLINELGDILWYVAEACEALHIPISNVMEANIRKLQMRYPDGFTIIRSLERRLNEPLSEKEI